MWNTGTPFVQQVNVSCMAGPVNHLILAKYGTDDQSCLIRGIIRVSCATLLSYSFLQQSSAYMKAVLKKRATVKFTVDTFL